MKANREFRTAAAPGQPPWLRMEADQINLLLHVQPGAKRTRLAGTHGERLKVAVAAPPLDGRANVAVLALLAERLDVPKSALHVAAGEASRYKRVVVAGCRLTVAQIVGRLQA